MLVTRLYTGQDGESKFGEIDIPLAEAPGVGAGSDPIPATGAVFRETRADFDRDFHPAPRRQFVFVQSGHVELTAGDGAKCLLGPGDVVLLEDTTGRGHCSRVVGGPEVGGGEPAARSEEKQQ